MANKLYDPGREGFLDGTIVWGTGTGPPAIKAALVRGYSFSLAHKWMSDVTGTIASTSAAFTGKSSANGIANAGSVTFPGVAANNSDHYIIIYQASAVTGGADVPAAQQRLIAYLDDALGSLPVRPNGNDITVTWDTGVNKIFKL